MIVYNDKLGVWSPVPPPWFINKKYFDNFYTLTTTQSTKFGEQTNINKYNNKKRGDKDKRQKQKEKMLGEEFADFAWIWFA